MAQRENVEVFHLDKVIQELCKEQMQKKAYAKHQLLGVRKT
jgi:hypothetical protein